MALKAKLRSCTKVQVFGVLLCLCVVSVLLFRDLFEQGYFFIKTFGLKVTAPGPSTAPFGSALPVGNLDKAAATTKTMTTTTTTMTSRGRDMTAGFDVSTTSSPPSDGGDNSTKKDPLSVVEGPGPLLEARGKVVKPQANATVPWVPDNTTILCPLVPPKLVGALKTYQDAPSFEEVVKLNPGLEPGGHFHPPDCRARSRVAVVIPYRNREQHLRILVHNLHPMLIRQQLDYAIIVVELAQPTEFNRAMLMNIGAVEALGLWDFQCFVFHDVDLIPENDRNLYTCPEMPRHMSVAVDKFGYHPLHPMLFGGVTALRREQFYALNGYPNKYFGWGGEDDDMSSRVTGSNLNLTITRYALDVARYRMIKHDRDSGNNPNPKRWELLNTWRSRHDKDGLSSLQYTIQNVEFRPAYTWINVSIDKDIILKS